jgi:hypothetical protein
MVRQDAIGQQADVHPVERFGQHTDKSIFKTDHNAGTGEVFINV